VKKIATEKTPRFHLLHIQSGKKNGHLQSIESQEGSGT
jgi:hypothetical protein